MAVIKRNLALEAADSVYSSRYKLNDSVTLSQFSDYSLLKDFEAVIEQAVPIKSNITSGDLYGDRGKVNPEEISPTQIVDQALKSIFSFNSTFSKQIGGLIASHLIKDRAQTAALVEIISYAVNALLGLATGGFSFNVFSIIGAVLGALGFSGLANILGMLFGQTKENLKVVQEQEDKVAKEMGKHVTAAIEATNEAVQNPEGNNVHISNVYQVEVNVQNTKSNVSINTQTPFMSVAAQSYVQTSTDHVITANYYKGSHTHWTIQADTAYSIYTRHGTRYHTASLLEVSGSTELVRSGLSDYADVRWTQTGGGSTSISSTIQGVLGDLLGGAGLPTTGVNIDLTSNAKLTSAQLVNANWGGIYTIDGEVVFINSGIGRFLQALPYRSVPAIQDLVEKEVVDRVKPGALVQLNNKTPDPTTYMSDPVFEGNNLGQLITDAINTSDQVKQQAETEAVTLRQQYNVRNQPSTTP